MNAGYMTCKGCGDPLTTNFQRAMELCNWCYAEWRMALYDERDADDEREQQRLDDRVRG